MSNKLSADLVDLPPCPECESCLAVSRCLSDVATWRCNVCETTFGPPTDSGAVGRSPIDPPTLDEQRRLEADGTQVVRASRRTIHIVADDSDTLCEKADGHGLRPSPIATYPVDESTGERWTPICKWCLRAWRMEADADE